MKKIYIVPEMDICEMTPENVIATSLEVSNTAVNNTAGDVKDLGNWADIWDSEE